jgi:hypothetical protein
MLAYSALVFVPIVAERAWPSPAPWLIVAATALVSIGALKLDSSRAQVAYSAAVFLIYVPSLMLVCHGRLGPRKLPEVLIQDRLTPGRAPCVLLPPLERVVVEGSDDIPGVTGDGETARLRQRPQPLDHGA